MRVLRASPMCAGMRIVPIGVDRNGNINMEELKQKAQDNSNE